MPLNINADPWYDDFNEDKNFHQILFRPGYSVQARELTQIQSILRNQIAKFGSHIFKHGSVVLPGNSNSDLNICFVKLQTVVYDLATLVGKVAVGTSGLRGLIRATIPATLTDPITIYVSYYNSGTAGEKVFGNGEQLTVAGVTTSFYTQASGATGGSAMAFISRGVFFVDGNFVGVEPQSVVIGKYSSTPSCRVLLKITESIVNSEQDQSLLDPAQGSYNYAAPGADRLKISLSLTTLELSAPIGDDYIELMRYNVGVLEEHLRYPKYNELEKSLARRTFDESGDYVVSGLEVKVREHLKNSLNGGRYGTPTGDAAKLVYTVSPGKAYIRGFENEIFSPIELIVDKARGASHLKTTTTNLVPSYGQFFYVSNIIGLPDFLKRESITLINATTGGSTIGSARVIAIDYLESNTTDQNAIYKLFVSDVVLTVGNTVSDVGRINFAEGSASVLNKLDVISDNAINFAAGELVTFTSRTSTVHKFTRATSELYTVKHSASLSPVIGDKITAPSGAAGRINSVGALGRNVTDNLLITLPTTSTYRVKNASNTTDMSYKIYFETSVTITAGAGSFSVTGMTIDTKETGNFIITSVNGVHPLSTAIVAADGLSVSFSGLTIISAATALATPIHVICAATKLAANAMPRTKSLATSFTQASLLPATPVQLSKADGVRIRSITSTADGDVTSRYSLDNGQRDYAYLRSSLILVPGAALPTGTLTVVYDYFNHNVGTGDYFSVDSYETSNLVDPISGLANYYESEVLFFKSKNTGNVYNLRNTLDFRPRVGDDGTFLPNRLVQIDSRITTSIQQYVGRSDIVILNKDGKLNVITGTPGERSSIPTIPDAALYLSRINLPAYTYKASDVRVVKQNTRVYTMQDVGKIDKRIDVLEEFVLLNSAESSAVNFDIIDSKTGLSRFKSGYLIDTFNNPDVIGDIYNTSFKVAYVTGNIIPQFEVIETPLVITSNLGQTTGSAITLPYTHVVMANQPVSSKVTNINPFSVFSWHGSMIVSPSTDTWTEVENLSSIINTQIETRTEVVNVRRPWDWVAPAGARVTFAPAALIVNTLMVWEGTA